MDRSLLSQTLHKGRRRKLTSTETWRNSMRNLLNRLRHDEEAATAVEYAIIAAIVGVALIGTLIAFRDSISQMLNRAAAVISSQ